MKKIIFLATLIITSGYATEPSKLIENYGPFKPVANTTYPTPQNLKTVFDVYTSDDDKSKINKGINTVARFLNMHHNAGVKSENIQAALVIHGSAAKDILSDQAYHKQFGINNPNSDLLLQLHKHGVEIIVCGQSVEFKEYKRDEILDFVKVSLSAITALTDLQQKGYAIINFN
ncbi:MAG TPA: DsrE family protein [Gammaproteobacteria bacterium]|nr:DsrE family protein [Xanthomonadales bacterium]MCB1593610.1 DsrE family protein [Xanthomonadales bacterium]HOP22981.1 DsrE family protein [Gammaproteobacteria bacterium]HPI96706.1 DsrE family protein [Gammaproteobacteria bacterium]HPQ88088.1 DsrE family protein [Gammaproteobacteria bacterium]